MIMQKSLFLQMEAESFAIRHPHAQKLLLLQLNLLLSKEEAWMNNPGFS